jgi:UDP-glucose 4-epimerase
MRVVVIGATGNVGTSVLRSLASEPSVDEIYGIARRLPPMDFAKTAWIAADVSTDDLAPYFQGADAVIHLAWQIQPSRDEERLYRANVVGSRRVFDAVAKAGVGTVVYASSVGTYSPGPKEYPVDESWPTNGVETSFYSRHKAEVERILDDFEEANRGIRVVRLRPALTFKAEAATGIRRLFAGPLLPTFLLRRALIPAVPDLERLRFQCVHSHDVGEAYRTAVISDVRGAFNIASEPILDPDELSELFGARKIRMSEHAIRIAIDLTWRMRLQPTPVGWVDMAFETPLLDWSRAAKELDWEPRYSSMETLLELMEGLSKGADAPTPPLAKQTTTPARTREFLTGIGSRSGA